MIYILEVVRKPFELPSATPPTGFSWPREIQHMRCCLRLATPLPYPVFRGVRPVALRPTLSRGLPFSSCWEQSAETGKATYNKSFRSVDYNHDFIVNSSYLWVNDRGHNGLRVKKRRGIWAMVMSLYTPQTERATWTNIIFPVLPVSFQLCAIVCYHVPTLLTKTIIPAIS